MSTLPQQAPAGPQVPGFIAVFFDIPFPISIPNGTYLAYDPLKEMAAVTVALREGSRAFFRNRPITGPTSFEELTRAWQEPARPRGTRSYLAVCRLNDGRDKATLNVTSGVDGGYAECKYFTEVCVTYLDDDLNSIGQQDLVLRRACEILNPFLDKYRLLNEDYRISRVSQERNYYFAVCHTSPLEPNESGLSTRELFERLQEPRTFRAELGQGAANILRTNSFELLGPRSPIVGGMLEFFSDFIKGDYQIPLSYELMLDGLQYLQRFREYRLAIVHAETAVEVHVRDLLARIMSHCGMTSAQAENSIENGRDFWGVKNKVRRLDEWTDRYCTDNGHAYTPFVGSTLFQRWETDLYGRRNAAVHAGASSFSYDEASRGIGIAKECIIFFESRLPGLNNPIQLNSSMDGFRNSAGEVMF
jgi:hypothetical protein